jgi:hypothetical protein
MEIVNASEQAQLELGQAILDVHDDPYGFVMLAYPWGEPGTSLERYDGPDVWQKQFLLDLGEQVKERAFDGFNPVSPIRMAAASGHGVGKSTLVAWIVNWIMSTRPNCQGTVTANTFPQLETKTWAAITKWTKLSITRHWFDIRSESISFKKRFDSWRVSAQSSKETNSESFAGQHAADSTSFYFFDEASSIPDKIFEVAFGGLTDGEPMMFCFGNPTRNTGQFHRICFGSERRRWKTYSIDSRTSKFSNKQLIAEWAETFGEDSDFFRVRIKGEAPRQGMSQFISPEIVSTCRKLQLPEAAYMTLPKILAVDVARYGDDASVAGLRQGRKFDIKGNWRGKDTVEVANLVIEIIEAEDPDAVIVDGDGLGAGVVDQIKHRGFGRKLFEFHGGGRPDDAAMYFNRRAEVWGAMRDWLNAGADIPDLPQVETDLCGPDYFFSPKGQIQLEPKDAMKARGLDSPDIGDCLAMSHSEKIAATRKPVPKPQYAYPGADTARWMA